MDIYWKQILGAFHSTAKPEKFWTKTVIGNTRSVVHVMQIDVGNFGKKIKPSWKFGKKLANFQYTYWDLELFGILSKNSSHIKIFGSHSHIKCFEIQTGCFWLNGSRIYWLKKSRASVATFLLTNHRRMLFIWTNQVQKQNQSWTSLTRVFPPLALV